MSASKDAFLESHRTAIALIRDGKEPTLFERQTADALYRAYELSRESQDQFRAVSAATGSGKTLGGQALMAHLFNTSGGTSAIVIREIVEAHRAYLNLVQLVGPENVVIHTTAHRQSRSYATQQARDKLAAEGLSVDRTFTDAEFASAPIVVCTHTRWQHEITSGQDRGVRSSQGKERDLILVDEDPELERVFVAAPEDVSALASVLADKVLSEEFRSYFGGPHPAASVIEAVHRKMRTVFDAPRGRKLLAQTDLVTAREAQAIRGLTRADWFDRLSYMPHEERTVRSDDLDTVREFLLAAADGRVFFASGFPSAFYAYSYSVPPQPNTIILDAGADLNHLFAIGQSLVTVEDVPQANYQNVPATYVRFPREYRRGGFWDRSNVKRIRMKDFMVWFMDDLVSKTSEGETVLVYAPQNLLDTDLHNDYDESADHQNRADARYTEWLGRKIHWAHLGSGRGTNKFRDATAFFQIRPFHRPKAVVVARIASATNSRLDQPRLDRLSSGRTKDSQYVSARDSLLIQDMKQNASRIIIRQLDDHGVAPPARLYFYDYEIGALRHFPAAFPGAPKMIFENISEKDLKSLEEPRVGPTVNQKIADLIMTTDRPILTSKYFNENTGLRKQNWRRAMAHPEIVAAMELRGYVEASRADLRLRGKGKVVVDRELCLEHPRCREKVITLQ